MRGWRRTIPIGVTCLGVWGCEAPAPDARAEAPENGAAPGPTAATPDSLATVTPARHAEPVASGTGSRDAPAKPTAASSGSAPTPSAAPDGRCPPEMARIGRFCVDRWEAHLLGPDGTVHARNVPPLDGVTYTAKSAPGVHPQGHINRPQAQAACQAAGKRLCAWIEWRRACQGPKWHRWPYGNAREEGACNSGKSHLVRELFGDDPRTWTQEKFNDPRFNERPGYLAKAGEHERCVSPEGIFDMVGNLHEWVVDDVSSAFLRKMEEESMSREKQPYALGNGMFLGGFYSTRSEHGQGCFFVTIAHSASYYDYSTGFRCCKDAAPSQEAASQRDAAPSERAVKE